MMSRICMSRNFIYSKVTFKSISLIEIIIELKAAIFYVRY